MGASVKGRLAGQLGRYNKKDVSMETQMILQRSPESHISAGEEGHGGGRG